MGNYLATHIFQLDFLCCFSFVAVWDRKTEKNKKQTFRGVKGNNFL